MTIRGHRIFRYGGAALAALCLAGGVAHAQRAALTKGMTMTQPAHGPIVLSPVPVMPVAPAKIGNGSAATPPPATVPPPSAPDYGPICSCTIFTLVTDPSPTIFIFSGTAKPVATLTAKSALDHVINTSQIVEAQSAAIVNGTVVLSGGQ
jgi:hypothetical protein